MTDPSNANTSGLASEIDAEMDGRQRGYADLRGELLFRCRDRIVELEAELSQANANGASHWSRATAAEARADRLAKIVRRVGALTVEGKDHTQFANAFPRFARLVAEARAALQQETRP